MGQVLVMSARRFGQSRSLTIKKCDDPSVRRVDARANCRTSDASLYRGLCRRISNTDSSPSPILGIFLILTTMNVARDHRLARIPDDSAGQSGDGALFAKLLSGPVRPLSRRRLTPVREPRNLSRHSSMR